MRLPKDPISSIDFFRSSDKKSKSKGDVFVRFSDGLSVALCDGDKTDHRHFELDVNSDGNTLYFAKDKGVSKEEFIDFISANYPDYFLWFLFNSYF